VPTLPLEIICDEDDRAETLAPRKNKQHIQVFVCNLGLFLRLEAKISVMLSSASSWQVEFKGKCAGQASALFELHSAITVEGHSFRNADISISVQDRRLPNSGKQGMWNSPGDADAGIVKLR
jgi:hypothetical protein